MSDVIILDGDDFYPEAEIENIERENKKLPYLLKYYRDNYKLVGTKNDITKKYNEENNLDEEQNAILRKEVFSSDK